MRSRLTSPLPRARGARVPLWAALLGLVLCSSACGDDGSAPGADGSVDGGAVDAELDGGEPVGPRLRVPPLLRLPFIEAGAGEVSAELELSNDGSALTLLSFALSGDAGLVLDTPLPTRLAAGDSARVAVRFLGAAQQHVALGSLRVTWAGGTAEVRVVAVAGALGVPEATYLPVLAAGGAPCGEGTTVALPAAPFPHASGPWTDASVRVFLPEGYRQHEDHDLVLHFHGHNTTLASTLAAHRYEQHVCASGANVILVVPQGPLSAASGNFGKLMTPAGTAALLDQVLIMLYRDGRVDTPRRGQLTLTSHSGGYIAVANNANAAELHVQQAHLYDSLYGSIAAYTSFATGGGALRSNYTSSGGTLASNQALAASLAANFPGVSLSEDATLLALRDVSSVIDFTPATHNGATRYRNAYGDRVRFGSRRGVRGGRLELRSATAEGSTAQVTFVAPRDEQRVGFDIEAAEPGEPFTLVAQVPAGARSATWTVSGPGSLAVRVRARLADPSAPSEPSDTLALTPDTDILVVDGFERVLGGSFGGRAHDFAARVGVPLGASAVSHRALTEDAFALTGYRVVVWLAGDQSVDDEALSAAERDLLSAYLVGGGALVVSGSEVAFALAGETWLAQLGAAFVSDNAGSHVVDSAASLGATLSGVAFGGPLAPYEEDFPDVLSAGAGASVLLRYSTGGAAAVGVAGHAALVGFPLEVIESDTQRAALVHALLAFVSGG